MQCYRLAGGWLPIVAYNEGVAFSGFSYKSVGISQVEVYEKVRNNDIQLFSWIFSKRRTLQLYHFIYEALNENNMNMKNFFSGDLFIIRANY